MVETKCEMHRTVAERQRLGSTTRRRGDAKKSEIFQLSPVHGSSPRAEPATFALRHATRVSVFRPRRGLRFLLTLSRVHPGGFRHRRSRRRVKHMPVVCSGSRAALAFTMRDATRSGRVFFYDPLQFHALCSALLNDTGDAENHASNAACAPTERPVYTTTCAHI